MNERDAAVTTVTAAVELPPTVTPRLLPHDMVKSVIKRRGVRQFVKFGIVGGSGLIVNLVLFTILQRITPAVNPDPIYSLKFSGAFLAGGVSNYFLNRIWTFRSSAHAFKQGVQFIVISLVALAVALTVTHLLVPHLGAGHKTWFLATLSAIVVNFFANKYWTFKEALAGSGKARGVRIGPEWFAETRSDEGATQRRCDRRATKYSAEQAGSRRRRGFFRGLLTRDRWWFAALGAALVLGLALRLRGIHDPILDHPGWRQGDTAAIARNLRRSISIRSIRKPTTTGRRRTTWNSSCRSCRFSRRCSIDLRHHEVFGRLISIGFSLGTVAVLAYFARWMFASRVAGIVAAVAFAIYPGSAYYGRTFTPDTTMVFFLTAAVFASTRWIVDDDFRPGRGFWIAALLAAFALLAKPVAIVGLVPIAVAMIAARGVRGTLRTPLAYAFFALALAPYVAYDAYVRSIAEWHWASGITTLHVLPSLRGAFGSFDAFGAKFAQFRLAIGMLRHTMLGLAGFILFVLAAIFQARSRSTPMLYGWLAAALIYAYVVVTVERVDYYLYPFLPLAALWTGGFAIGLTRWLPPNARRYLAVAGRPHLHRGADLRTVPRSPRITGIRSRCTRVPKHSMRPSLRTRSS